MEQRIFKRVSVIGLDFYVDFYDKSGKIICIKEVHSGKRFIPDNLYLGKEPVLDLFKKAIGFETTKNVVEEVKPVAEVKEEVKLNAKKAGKRASK